MKILYKTNDEDDLIKKFEIIENLEVRKIYNQKLKKKKVGAYTIFKHCNH